MTETLPAHAKHGANGVRRAVVPTIRLLARLSTSHFARHRARVVLTCVGIALGVGAITAVLALSRSIVDTFQASVVRGAGAAQLQVSNGTAGLDRDLVDRIAGIAGVAATGATVQHNVVLPALGRRITIFGVELGRDEAYREVQTGPDVADIPDALTFIAHTDSIALSSALHAERGWVHGQTLDVTGAKGSQVLTVRGTLHPKGALEAFGGDVALMDLDAAQLKFGNPDRVHWIDVVVADPADVRAVESGIVALLQGRGKVESPMARGRRIESMLSLLRVLLTGSGIIAMMVGIFLIHHTLSTSYRQRRSDLVRLRALGLSRRWLLTYLVSESAAVGLVASLIGVAGGIGLWRLATRGFAGTVSTLFIPIPAPQFALTIAEAGSVVALGTLAVVIGALSPVVPMLRLRPMEMSDAQVPSSGRRAWVLALFGGGMFVCGVLIAPTARHLGFLGQVAVIGTMAGCFFIGSTLLVPVLLQAGQPLLRLMPSGVPALLSRWTWHQVQRRRVHTSTTIGALAAGVAFALGMTILLGSYRAAFHSWFEQTFVGDVVVNAGPTISLLGGQTLEAALQDTLAAVDGVDRVFLWRFVEVEFRGEPIVLQAMSEELLSTIYPEFHFDESTVAISDTLAEHFGLAEGDMFEVPAPVGALSLRVGAVVPDYVLHLGSVKLGWRTFARHFADDRVSLFLVDAKVGSSPTHIKSQIEHVLGNRYDVSVLTATEVRHLVEELVDRSIVLTYWLQVLAALVAVAAIVNATSASIIDREGELRMWRALGLLRLRLVRVLVGEALVVGAVGSLLGVLCGVILGLTLTAYIARAVAGFRLAVHWPITAMIALPAISAAAAGLAAALVALRWTRGRALTDAPQLSR